MAQRPSPPLAPTSTFSTPSSFSTADMLQALPDETIEELLDITNETALTSHLKKLQELIRFNIGYNATDLYSSPSGFSKVITHPSGAAAIYYYLSPVYVSPNQNQTYALLMLKFTNSSRIISDELITTDGNRIYVPSVVIDYNVKINGTNNFNFEENGTTGTGIDIKIIRGISLINALSSPGNYSMVIDILNMNYNPVNEQTKPLSVNLTR